MAKAKLLALGVLGLLLAGCAGGAPAQTLPPETTASPTIQTTPVTLAAETTASLPQPETTVPPTQPEAEAFLLTFVGDCTFGAHPGNTYAEVGFPKTVGQDYGYPFRNVAAYFTQDDATFLNLEGPLTDRGNPRQKAHVFRGPVEYVNILTQSSVQAVSLANNHAHDYGPEGYEHTCALLAEAGVPAVERDDTLLFTLEGGLKVGMYGMVYYRLDVQDMTQKIQALKEQGAELIIVAPHWGVEGTYLPTQEQTAVGRAAIDAGAHIVWGSHPHVLQPIEEYGDGVIFYSLGNFSFGGNSLPADFDTALIQQEVIREPDGSVRLGQRTLIPASISSIPERNNYQPTPYQPESPEYQRVLEKLAGTFS